MPDETSENEVTVSLEEYERLMEDRPAKFTAEEVNFHLAKAHEPMCCACMHWYRGAVMEKDVCEIMRPKNEQVPWNWTCQFHTKDGERFPLYDQ